MHWLTIVAAFVWTSFEMICQFESPCRDLHSPLSAHTYLNNRLSATLPCTSSLSVPLSPLPHSLSNQESHPAHLCRHWWWTSDGYATRAFAYRRRMPFCGYGGVAHGCDQRVKNNIILVSTLDGNSNTSYTGSWRWARAWGQRGDWGVCERPAWVLRHPLKWVPRPPRGQAGMCDVLKLNLNIKS